MANKLGNGLTYGKFILIMIAGRTLSMAAAYGINLPMNEVELAGYLGILAGFIYSILDSYFKNNLKWTHFKKFISKILNEEVPEDEDESQIENNIIDDVDPTTETIEPEDEDIIDEVVGDDVDDTC